MAVVLAVTLAVAVVDVVTVTLCMVVRRDVVIVRVCRDVVIGRVLSMYLGIIFADWICINK
jgi:hypothetical protein